MRLAPRLATLARAGALRCRLLGLTVRPACALGWTRGVLRRGPGPGLRGAVGPPACWLVVRLAPCSARGDAGRPPGGWWAAAPGQVRTEFCAGLAGYLLVASPWRRCSEHACHSMEKIGLCGARPACDAKAGRNRSSYSHRAAVAVRSVNVARRTISSTSATTTTTTARFTTLPTCCPTSTVGGGVVTEDGGGGGCGVHQGEMGYHR